MGLGLEGFDPFVPFLQPKPVQQLFSLPKSNGKDKKNTENRLGKLSCVLGRRFDNAKALTALGVRATLPNISQQPHHF